MKIILFIFFNFIPNLISVNFNSTKCEIVVNLNPVKFNGSQLFYTYPTSRNQVELLDKIRQDYDFWSPAVKCGPTEIFVNQDGVTKLWEYLKLHTIPFEITQIPEWKLSIGNKTGGKLKSYKIKKAAKTNFNFKRYHDLSTIYQWMDGMAGKYENLTEVIVIGKSVEKRPLKIIKISIKDKVEKPSLWLDAGIHAREWASPSTACYILNELLTKRSNILTHVDIYIMPMVNPDGYVYSRTKDRMWRKNRRPNGRGSCVGVDLNRNFGFHFGGPGSSSNTCSEIYRGTKAFSEPESRAIRNFFSQNNKINWKLYMSLHTFGQAILTPWGYTNQQPKDYADLKSLGDKAAAALKKVYGTQYKVGTSTALFGLAAGGSDDWAKGSGHFKYSYTLELRDNGKFGFALPEKQIIPTGQETFEAFQTFAEFLVTLKN